MQPINEELLHGIEKYIEQLFVLLDAALEQNLKDATMPQALPAIAVAPDQGRLIYILAKMTGAKRILEIGTLGGYSTTLLARALPKRRQACHTRNEPGGCCGGAQKSGSRRRG